MKRLLRIVGLLLVVLLIIVIVPLVGVVIQCRPFGEVTANQIDPGVSAPSLPAIQQAKEGLQGYTRLEDQTYLTLPEWYIVYSIDEYAAFIQEQRPSQFPYFGAIRQYWQSYYDVCAVTRDQYVYNSGYHLSLMVIGTSFTLENIIKGLYENTLGRVAEWVSTSELSEEDAYARTVATEYGNFIHTIPWYEFPFAEKLNTLWAQTSGWGPNVIRKWERKLALSLEYGGKALYGRLIKQGTAATYAPEKLEIQAIVTGFSEAMLQEEADLRLVQTINATTTVIAITRYEAFTKIVPKLVAQGVQFVEIAGNDEILLTAFAPSDWEYGLPEGEFLFALPILTQPATKRIAVNVTLPTLHLVLTELEKQGVRLEHLYDY